MRIDDEKHNYCVYSNYLYTVDRNYIDSVTRLLAKPFEKQDF